MIVSILPLFIISGFGTQFVLLALFVTLSSTAAFVGGV